MLNVIYYKCEIIDVSDSSEQPSIQMDEQLFYYAGEDKELTMKCELPRDGNPPVSSYIWFQDDTEDIGISDQERTLTLDHVDKDGDYTCQAFNQPQTGLLGSEISDSAQVNIHGE